MNIRTGWLSSKRPKKLKVPSVVALRQDPPPPPPPLSYFVIFGCRALIFFLLFESSWKNMKMTPLLCACAVGITLETQKCRKRVPRSSNLTSLLIAIDRNGFRRMKEEGQIYKGCLRFLIFAYGLSYGLSYNLSKLVMILPCSFNFKRP